MIELLPERELPLAMGASALALSADPQRIYAVLAWEQAAAQCVVWPYMPQDNAGIGPSSVQTFILLHRGTYRDAVGFEWYIRELGVGPTIVRIIEAREL